MACQGAKTYNNFIDIRQAYASACEPASNKAAKPQTQAAGHNTFFYRHRSGRNAAAEAVASYAQALAVQIRDRIKSKNSGWRQYIANNPSRDYAVRGNEVFYTATVADRAAANEVPAPIGAALRNTALVNS